MYDFIENWAFPTFPIVCMIMIVGVLIALPFAIYNSIAQENRFMLACVKERAEYECVAMWRRGP